MTARLRDCICQLNQERAAAKARKSSLAYLKRRSELAVAARRDNSQRKQLSSLKQFLYKTGSAKKLYGEEELLKLLADRTAEQERLSSLSQASLRQEWTDKCMWGWRCECGHIIRGMKTASAVKTHEVIQVHVAWASGAPLLQLAPAAGPAPSAGRARGRGSRGGALRGRVARGRGRGSGRSGPSVMELKASCRSRGLPVSGTKPVLLARIPAHDALPREQGKEQAEKKLAELEADRDEADGDKDAEEDADDESDEEAEEEAGEESEGDEGREDNDVNGSDGDASGETNTPESSDSEPHPVKQVISFTKSGRQVWTSVRS